MQNKDKRNDKEKKVKNIERDAKAERHDVVQGGRGLNPAVQYLGALHNRNQIHVKCEGDGEGEAEVVNK
jgi:hypothetical protein